MNLVMADSMHEDSVLAAVAARNQVMRINRRTQDQFAAAKGTEFHGFDMDATAHVSSGKRYNLLQCLPAIDDFGCYLDVNPISRSRRISA